MAHFFSDAVLKALAHAQREAQRLSHACVGREHILLGLLVEGTNIAATVLRDLPVNSDRVRAEVEKLPRPEMVRLIGELPFSARAQQALDCAAAEAQRRKHQFVDTTHLLLSLIEEWDGSAGTVLFNLGLDGRALRAKLHQLLGSVPMTEHQDQWRRTSSGAIMFERFTDRARRVMAFSNQEAQRFNHNYIGTEHILLGLVKEGSGVGANVLKNLAVDLRKVRLEVEKLVKIGPEMVTAGKLPQTPRAKRVIEYAIAEAKELHHNYIGTEHLLLGLVKEDEGVAANALINLGLRLDVVRAEVLNLLGAGVQPSETTAKHDLVLEEKVAPPVLRWLAARLVEALESYKDQHVKAANYDMAANVRALLERARELATSIQSLEGPPTQE